MLDILSPPLIGQFYTDRCSLVRSRHAHSGSLYKARARSDRGQSGAGFHNERIYIWKRSCIYYIDSMLVMHYGIDWYSWGSAMILVDADDKKTCPIFMFELMLFWQLKNQLIHAFYLCFCLTIWCRVRCIEQHAILVRIWFLLMLKYRVLEFSLLVKLLYWDIFNERNKWWQRKPDMS